MTKAKASHDPSRDLVSAYELQSKFLHIVPGRGSLIKVYMRNYTKGQEGPLCPQLSVPESLRLPVARVPRPSTDLLLNRPRLTTYYLGPYGRLSKGWSLSA